MLFYFLYLVFFLKLCALLLLIFGDFFYYLLFFYYKTVSSDDLGVQASVTTMIYFFQGGVPSPKVVWYRDSTMIGGSNSI